MIKKLVCTATFEISNACEDIDLVHCPPLEMASNLIASEGLSSIMDEASLLLVEVTAVDQGDE